MTEFQIMAAKTALKQMFEKSYFDICTLDKIIKMSGCIPDKKDYQALSALHCVHFNEMEKELRDLVFLKSMQIFENTGFDTDLIGGLFSDTKKLNGKTKNFIGRTFALEAS